MQDNIPKKASSNQHASLAYELWSKLQDLTKEKEFEINGETLDIPSVVATSRYIVFYMDIIEIQHN
jgi:hypothetical protein